MTVYLARELLSEASTILSAYPAKPASGTRAVEEAHWVAGLMHAISLLEPPAVLRMWNIPCQDGDSC